MLWPCIYFFLCSPSSSEASVRPPETIASMAWVAGEKQVIRASDRMDNCDLCQLTCPGSLALLELLLCCAWAWRTRREHPKRARERDNRCRTENNSSVGHLVPES